MCTWTYVYRFSQRRLRPIKLTHITIREGSWTARINAKANNNPAGLDQATNSNSSICLISQEMSKSLNGGTTITGQLRISGTGIQTRKQTQQHSLFNSRDMTISCFQPCFTTDLLQSLHETTAVMASATDSASHEATLLLNACFK